MKGATIPQFGENRHMIANFPFALQGACLALCLVGAAPVWALGLGEIKSKSTLFGSLTAQIELKGASSVDLRQLSIRFGSVDEYLQIGEHRPSYLSVIKLSPGRDSRGNPVIHLDSQNSIEVAVLSLLIRVTTPRGQIQKFYNLLLDPPNWDIDDAVLEQTMERSAATAAAQFQGNWYGPRRGGDRNRGAGDDARGEQTVDRETLIAAGLVRNDWYGPVRGVDRNGGASDDARGEHTVDRETFIAAGLVRNDWYGPVRGEDRNRAANDDARREPIVDRDTLTAAGIIRGDRYGPVSSGDRIILVARRTRPDHSINVNQMMLAYLRANPTAFIRGNLSGLRQGVILRIPSHAEAEQLSKVAAASRVALHNSTWKNGDTQSPEEITVEWEIDAVPDHLAGTSALKTKFSNSKGW
jgi:FimV-like protein